MDNSGGAISFFGYFAKCLRRVEKAFHGLIWEWTCNDNVRFARIRK